MTSTPLVLDIETEPLPPNERVRTQPLQPTVVLVGLKSAGHTEALLDWNDGSLSESILGHQGLYVFHNAKFDLACLRSLGITLDPARVRDTMVMYRLRYPLKDRLRNLAAVHAHLFPRRAGLVKEDGTRLSFRRYQPVSREQETYLRQDLQATWDVYHRLLELAPGELARKDPTWEVSALHDCRAEADVDAVFCEAAANLELLESRGLDVDQEKLTGHHKDLIAKVSDLELWLHDHQLAKKVRRPKAKPRPTSGDTTEKKWTSINDLPFLYRTHRGQFQEVDAEYRLDNGALRRLFSSEAARLHLDPPKSQKTRKLTLSEDYWREFRTKLTEPAAKFLEFVRAKKYLSAFVEPLVSSQAKRVYPNYHVHGAETGRWSCNGPNVQQLPRKLKDIYRAPSGQSFYTVDYKTLELYTLAQAMYNMGIDGQLRQHLNTGLDVHRLAASEMYDTEPTGINDDQRQAAKTCNFGLPGGMGPRKFQAYAHTLGLNWTLGQTREVISRWFVAYPDVREYLDRFKLPSPFVLKPPNAGVREWLEDLGHDLDVDWPSDFEIVRSVDEGAVYTAVLPSGRVVPRRTFAAAANCFFQGLGADVVTVAFNNCCRRGLSVVAVIHDSVTITAPQDEEFPGYALIDEMTKALERFCPDLKVPTLTFKETKTL